MDYQENQQKSEFIRPVIRCLSGVLTDIELRVVPVEGVVDRNFSLFVSCNTHGHWSLLKMDMMPW